MPYHEELMLLLSYPLRLNASVECIDAEIIGINVVCSVHHFIYRVEYYQYGSCSGINQRHLC